METPKDAYESALKASEAARELARTSPSVENEPDREVRRSMETCTLKIEEMVQMILFAIVEHDRETKDDVLERLRWEGPRPIPGSVPATDMLETVGRAMIRVHDASMRAQLRASGSNVPKELGFYRSEREQSFKFVQRSCSKRQGYDLVIRYLRDVNVRSAMCDTLDTFANTLARDIVETEA